MRSQVVIGAIGLIVWLVSATGAGADPVFRVNVDEARLVGFEENSANLEAISCADYITTSFDMTPDEVPAPKVSRPAILPALYATLVAMQAWDLYSTNAAMKAGGREANPTVAAFAGNASALIGLKAATTASTIFFAERMWKKNRMGAIVMLVAVNGATAAISMHNMRNAKLSAARR